MSATELVDIVNENDEVVAVVPRKVMRQKHLPHRASYIVVMDGQERILVEIRTLCKDYAPGLFDACVGGVIQSGEEPDLSASRELKEEIGVDAGAIEFKSLGKMAIPYKSGTSFVMAYLYIARGSFITMRQQSEVSGIMLLHTKELARLKDSCTYDSFIAYEEILHRAHEAGIISSESF
ncbi:MAG: NUDIX domain-containing protein [Candidatus Anaerobiospirillum pullicola]|uniref:NUDIX domain-containing protein n=1 Tax=Candidatus Anaerobiospirillum pullicola TaxID=2838451 RepID=A0A948TGZ0_9GAMM|nr:NUDIX domain-containing protein [Candidatus Anaerobiospirillum pullicola]